MSETNHNHKHEYCISQYYSITPDESQIDRELESWTYPDEKSKQEDTAFLHRLFQGIANNETALQQCMVYLTLVEHDASSGDSTYVEEFYKKRVPDFLDILFTLVMRQKDCLFTPEDRSRIIREIKDATKNPDPHAREGIGYFFEPVEQALRATITPSGFEVKRIVYQCAECGAEQ